MKIGKTTWVAIGIIVLLTALWFLGSSPTEELRTPPTEQPPTPPPSSGEEPAQWFQLKPGDKLYDPNTHEPVTSNEQRFRLISVTEDHCYAVVRDGEGRAFLVRSASCLPTDEAEAEVTIETGDWIKAPAIIALLVAVALIVASELLTYPEPMEVTLDEITGRKSGRSSATVVVEVEYPEGFGGLVAWLRRETIRKSLAAAIRAELTKAALRGEASDALAELDEIRAAGETITPRIRGAAERFGARISEMHTANVEGDATITEQAEQASVAEAWGTAQKEAAAAAGVDITSVEEMRQFAESQRWDRLANELPAMLKQLVTLLAQMLGGRREGET